jgi:hypothetical protein
MRVKVTAEIPCATCGKACRWAGEVPVVNGRIGDVPPDVTATCKECLATQRLDRRAIAFELLDLERQIIQTWNADDQTLARIDQIERDSAGDDILAVHLRRVRRTIARRGKVTTGDNNG